MCKIEIATEESMSSLISQIFIVINGVPQSLTKLGITGGFMG